MKLAEAPSFGQSILQYAPESRGARDYRALAQAVLAQAAKPADAGRNPGDEVDPESVKELLEVTLEPVRRQEETASPRNGTSPVRP